MMQINIFLKGFKKGMTDFGQTLVLIVNSALLFVVYVLGVGLTSIFAKISGKHFLETRISKKRKTYWTDLNLKKKAEETYYRQF